MSYQPPYTLTPAIVLLMAEVVEAAGRLSLSTDDFRDYMIAFLFLRYLSDKDEVLIHATTPTRQSALVQRPG